MTHFYGQHCKTNVLFHICIWPTLQHQCFVVNDSYSKAYTAIVCFIYSYRQRCKNIVLFTYSFCQQCKTKFASVIPMANAVKLMFCLIDSCGQRLNTLVVSCILLANAVTPIFAFTYSDGQRLTLWFCFSS